jgi:iron complex transport system substrate-binding protein
MKKVILYLSIFLFICFPLIAATDAEYEPAEDLEWFLDDCGRKVYIRQPATRIISLYSAHTENLYSLGLEREIIGVGRADKYPPEVKRKPVFDYRSDPEKVIAADPDLVLIRPFIEKSSPNFVDALIQTGIYVVCLYPEKFEDFDSYIRRLAQLTGKEKRAEELLNSFHRRIDEVAERTAEFVPKTAVFFEATENDYRTVTTDSMASRAISYAGGMNIASDAAALHEGTSIASYGTERLLEKAEEIDVYVAQQGRMNPSAEPDAIAKRPGFHVIKAVREGRVYVIDQKIVSSPTFRFAQGVEELARMFYPEQFK